MRLFGTLDINFHDLRHRRIFFEHFGRMLILNDLTLPPNLSRSRIGGSRPA